MRVFVDVVFGILRRVAVCDQSRSREHIETDYESNTKWFPLSGFAAPVKQCVPLTEPQVLDSARACVLSPSLKQFLGRKIAMYNIFYIIGAIVVLIIVLRFLGVY
jgi:hypothetical protein